MQTFNGDRQRRSQYVDRAIQLQTRFARGEKPEQLYFTNSFACRAIYVCKLPNCEHKSYADELCVPAALAYAERGIFENLGSVAGSWPKKFVSALPAGLNTRALDTVVKKFALFILSDKKHGLINYATDPAHYAAIGKVIELYESGCTDRQAWQDAASGAHDASKVLKIDNKYRMSSSNAHIAAGDQACSAAAYLAASFTKPGHFAEAIQWAAWCMRYKTYAYMMASVPNYNTRTHWYNWRQSETNGHSYSEWGRITDRCDLAGEQNRHNVYIVYGDELLRLIRQCGRENLGLIGVFFAGRNPQTARVRTLSSVTSEAV